MVPVPKVLVALLPNSVRTTVMWVPVAGVPVPSESVPVIATFAPNVTSAGPPAVSVAVFSATATVKVAVAGAMPVSPA